MSRTIYVEGIKPPDEKWLKMKQVYDACKAAKLEAPSEVQKFFDYREPDAKGVIVEQKKLGDAVTELTSEDAMGYDVDLTKLDKDITILRFSYS